MLLGSVFVPLKLLWPRRPSAPGVGAIAILQRLPAWGCRQEGGTIPRTTSLSGGYRVLKIPPPPELVFPFGSLSIF